MLYRPAFLLGYAGLLPALCALTVAAFGPLEWQAPAVQAGTLYAGLILSFLGGSWWGLASRAPAKQAALLYGIAVLPTLAALILLLMTSPWRLVLLGIALLLALAGDRLLVRLRLAPTDWMKLRVPLSLGLAACTIALSVVAR